MIHKYALLFLILILTGCPSEDCDGPTSGSNVPNPGSITAGPPSCQWNPAILATDAECRTPRVDTAFSVDSYKGVIAFGLGNPCQEEEDVLQFVGAYMAKNWNTFEICSETEFWDEGACTTYPRKPRDPERLKWTLDIIARIPGAQVALIGNCTLKRQIPLDQQLKMIANGTPVKSLGVNVSDSEVSAWHNIVARVVTENDFKNVAIFTHNEFDNCAGRADWGGRPGNCAGKEDVKQHIRDYRNAGIAVVTADDSFSWPRPGDSEKLTYEFRLANIGAWPASFHPDREKNGQPWDPSPHMLEQLARWNGTYILSETVALMDYSGRCDGLRTCNVVRVERFIANCAAVSNGQCKFTLHGENNLAGIVGNEIPEAK